VGSARRPSDGRVMENAFAETLSVLCLRDSFTGNATAYQETFRVNGVGSQGDVFAFDWPRGSGTSSQISACDGALDTQGGNLLTNSGFDAWSSGVPTDWTLVTGTAGTNISQDTGIVCRGASSLKITGDAGGTLTRLRQEVTGLSPLSQYGLAVWLQRDGVPAGAGALRLRLTDAGGTVLEDPEGNDCVVDVALTALPSVYAPYGGPVRTPRSMPDEVYVDLILTTALTDGRSVYADLLSMTGMTQLYLGGPSLSVHSGGAAPAMNDLGTLAVVNPRGAGGTLSTWQTLLARLFPEASGSELLFPSSDAPSLLDAWIA
jgi:hypothetical protein